MRLGVMKTLKINWDVESQSSMVGDKRIGTLSSINTSKMGARIAATSFGESLTPLELPLLPVVPSLMTLMHSTRAAAAYPLAQPWPCASRVCSSFTLPAAATHLEIVLKENGRESGR